MNDLEDAIKNKDTEKLVETILSAFQQLEADLKGKMKFKKL